MAGYLKKNLIVLVVLGLAKPVLYHLSDISTNFGFILNNTLYHTTFIIYNTRVLLTFLPREVLIYNLPNLCLWSS
jgi:hypothetical protein